MNLQKEKRNFSINREIFWCDEVEISKIRKDLDEVEKLGATHINITHGISYECSYIEMEAVNIRTETDEEFEQRVKEIKEKEELFKFRELQELERLKLKYNQ